jgi:beta-lactamase regulating signal transducer with metallopeptidase domain
MILRHEKIHADSRYTTDILLPEILFLFKWFNPFAWLMKKAIKNNLEYLTDEEVTRKDDPQAYQLALVALAGEKGWPPSSTLSMGTI